MKAIQVDTIISGVRSKVDRSLSLTVQTPELSVKERALFMELQGMNTEMIITPKGDAKIPVEKIDGDTRTKTQSQRLRAVIYRFWEQNGKPDEFETFYRHETEKIITLYKSKLD